MIGNSQSFCSYSMCRGCVWHAFSQKNSNDIVRLIIFLSSTRCEAFSTYPRTYDLIHANGIFSLYKDKDAEIAAYTTCDGCPGGNVEYAPEEMKKNGIEVVHLATGLLVGYPPCPYIQYFKDFITTRYDMEVVVGTHPIPQKYYATHTSLGTWTSPEWSKLLEMVLTDEDTRLKYN